MWLVATTLLLSRIEVTVPGFHQHLGGTRSQGRGCLCLGKGEVGGAEMMGVGVVVTETRSSVIDEREEFWEFRYTCLRDYLATTEVHVRTPSDILLMCHVEKKSRRVVCRG